MHVIYSIISQKISTMRAIQYLLCVSLIAIMESCGEQKSSKSYSVGEDSSTPVTTNESSISNYSSSTSSTSSDYSSGSTYSEADIDLDEYGRGFLAGGEDGAGDALEGRSRRYKYGSGRSSEYIRGYKEAYDETYNEGVKVTEEAEREMERLESEYGLDDIDIDISDYDY